MTRLSFIYAILLLPALAALAQVVELDYNPLGSTERSNTETELPPVHPDGVTPQQRMLILAHTDALPRFDRAELFAVSLSDPNGPDVAGENTFPVTPYDKHAKILGHITLRGTDCDAIGEAWKKLSFDATGGAFCHMPIYAFRLYRGDNLLFETSICWECENFYLPLYDFKRNAFTSGWYGFANDAQAKALLELFQSHLKHPEL